MADYANTVSLNDYKLGDRWVGIATIGPITINESQPSNSLTRIRLQFTNGSDTFTLDSVGSNGIVISNATTWEATIAARDVFLASSGEWNWDMEFYQSGQTSPLTLYKGTITVYQDVR